MFRSQITLVGLSLLQGCALTGMLTSTSSNFVPEAPSGLEQRIKDEGATPNGRVDHFAVLIGGNTELRHRGNLSLAYQVLVEQGYERQDIFIFDSEGGTPFFPVTEVTTRAALYRVFDHLKQVVEPHDTVFIYVTGHGRRVKAEENENGSNTTIGVSTLVLNPGEELSEWEFSTLIDGLNPETGVALFDQCYGATFSTTNNCNFVFITTAAQDDTSYGVSFPRAFWDAFRQPEISRGAPTIFEAFKFAMVSDRGTRLGFNRPRITYGCVNPANLTLLGTLRPKAPVISAIDSIEVPLNGTQTPSEGGTSSQPMGGHNE